MSGEQLSAPSDFGLAQCKRRSDEWRNAGCLPRFLPQAVIGLVTPRSRRSFILSFFSLPSALTCLFIGQTPCVSLGLAGPDSIRVSFRRVRGHGRSPIELCLAIAKCRTLQHLPRCCPPPPIRDTGSMRKNKAPESTHPALTRTASLLALMDREL